MNRDPQAAEGEELEKEELGKEERDDRALGGEDSQDRDHADCCRDFGDSSDAGVLADVELRRISGERGGSDVGSTFHDRREVAHCIAEPRLIHGDARSLDAIGVGEAALVCTSPPCFDEAVESVLAGRGALEAAQPLWSVAAAQNRTHPHQSPPEMTRRILRLHGARGDLVVDPFAGSGQTLRLATAMGRRAVGCEIDQARVEAFHRTAPDAPHVRRPCDAHR